MIIVDKALLARAAANSPIRVGVAGAGFMGRGIANQIQNYTPGIKLAAMFSRNLDHARVACQEAGVPQVQPVESTMQLQDAMTQGACSITDNAAALYEAENIDVLIDATGAVEFGADFAMGAIRHRKPLVLMNAELDATVGPILKVHADKAGVIVSGCDGDQPGVQLNLYRFVQSIGLTPLVCGNIKGLQDRYRNPTTQAGFAEKWRQTPHMVTSFADGTKISFEQAIVANATGMRVAQRGMIGHQFSGHVDQLTKLFDVDQLRSWGGIVDYVVGAQPSPGIYVFAAANDSKQRRYLDYGKLGEGTLYSFYVPYHLTVFEVPLSVARVVLFNDVVATAKKALRAGETLDGLGGYMTYGQCENADVTCAARLLPMGLAEGCVLKRDISQDQVLTWRDVKAPCGSLVHQLRAEQDGHFFGAGSL
jgi:predicted homoserine dehydrogenase-like protein